MRALSLLLIAGSVMLPTACGGGDDSKASAPPGSPKNPLVAKSQTTATAGESSPAPASKSRGRKASRATGSKTPSSGSETQPGYQKLVDRQTGKPRSSFTPCNLVTKAQAREIVGAELRDPVEAPQGPTCIYRTKTGKGFVTLAVQTVKFKKIRPHLHQARRFKVSDRTAYCGQFGQAVLYVPLSRGRVLSVTAPCPVGRQFAATAVRRLRG